MDECENRKMESEKRWHSYWVSVKVIRVEGKRNNRLWHMEKEEFTEGETEKGTSQVRGTEKWGGGERKTSGRWTGTRTSNGTETGMEKRRGWDLEEDKLRRKSVFSSQGVFSLPTTSFASDSFASSITASYIIAPYQPRRHGGLIAHAQPGS